jgi:hypothetical protein
MAQDPEATRAKIQKRRTSKAAAKLPKVKPVVVADDKSDANRARSEKYQRSPAFRKAVRDVYNTKSVTTHRHTASIPQADQESVGGAARLIQPKTVNYGIKVKHARSSAERQALVNALRQRVTPTSAAILHEHDSRAARKLQLGKAQASHDVFTAEDRKRINKYVQTPDYKTALSDAAFAGAKRQGKDDLKAAEAASRAFDDAGKRALAAGVQLRGPIVPSALRKKVTSTALWTADQLSRPLYAVANASNEELKAAHGDKHVGLGKALAEGATLKKKTLFSDVLKTAHAPKWLRGPVGFIGDVAFDPTTYVTLGTGVPAEVAAKAAYRKALEEATARGVEKTIAEREGLAAAKATYAAHSVKTHGVTVGVRTPLAARAATKGLTGKSARREFATSGKLTGRGTKALKDTGSLLASPVADTKLGLKARETGSKVAENLVHDFRPRHIDPVTWEYMRNSARDFRAGRAKAERLGSHRATAYTKALKGVDRRDRARIFHALEASDFSTLSGHHLAVAKQIKQELEATYNQLVDHGLLTHRDALPADHGASPIEQLHLPGLESSAPQDAAAYFPRFVREEVFKLRQAANASSSSARIGGNALKGRKLRQALADMTPEERAVYDTRIPEAIGRHVQETERAVATKKLHDNIAALSKKVTAGDLLKAHQIKRGELEHLGDDDLRSALAHIEQDEHARLMVHDGSGYRLLQDKRGLVKLREALKSNGELLLVDNDLKTRLEELAGRGTGNHGDKSWNALGRGFDRTQGTLKTLQTVVNPGYHITNLIGDAFNAKVAGATSRDFVRGFQLKRIEGKQDKAYRKVFTKPGDDVPGRKEFYSGVGHELDDGEVVRLASEHGAIHTGMGGHELHELVNADDMAKPKGKLRPLDRIRTLNEKREDLTRLATFHSALKNGMSPSEAANWVNKHHFDYADLTETERSTLRRLIPFYTFMSRNTRAQVRGVLTRPGVYANAEAARQETTRASGIDPDFAKSLRDFEQNGVPWGVHLFGQDLALYPKLPLTDLNNINTSPGQMWQNLVSRQSPILKVAIEQTFGKDTFSRADYKPVVPAPGVFKNPTLRHEFNRLAEVATGGRLKNAVRDFNDPSSGKLVPGWSWRFDELMRQVPASSQFVNATVPSRAGREEDWKYALAGYLAGPRPQPLNGGVVALNQLWEKHDKLQKEHDTLVSRVAKHKAGAKWHGKIGQLNKEITKTERDIYKQAKALGSKNPPGLAPKKAQEAEVRPWRWPW